MKVMQFVYCRQRTFIAAIIISAMVIVTAIVCYIFLSLKNETFHSVGKPHQDQKKY